MHFPWKPLLLIFCRSKQRKLPASVEMRQVVPNCRAENFLPREHRKVVDAGRIEIRKFINQGDEIMPFLSNRSGFLAAVALLILGSLQGVVEGQDLADLKVDSKARRYDENNPVQAAKQEFAISKAGMLTLLFIIEPYQKDARGGFTPLEEVNLSNFFIGTGIYTKRTPDPGIPGQKYVFEQHWLCANREKPLNLRAMLIAPHRWNSIQDSRRGQQLNANQVLKVTFIPFDKISSQSGPKPAVNVAGKWYHGEQNAVLTFTPTGVIGEYDVVEKGYDNIKGTAKVKGNKVYIDWVTTTATGGKQKRGVTFVEMKPDGTHAEGWSVGEGGMGREGWSAVPGTKAKPVKSTETSSVPTSGATPGTAATPGGATKPGTVTLPGTTATPVSGAGGARSSRWEYRVLDLPRNQAFGDPLQKTLSELGEEGWELVSILTPPSPQFTSPTTMRFVLKKPKP